MEDDSALSPETCYECKINGYPKKNSRKRRHTKETQSAEHNHVSLASLDMEVPLALVLNASQLNPKEHILELVPAIKPLSGHVHYIIAAGNQDSLFRIQQRDGLSYLHSTRRLTSLTPAPQDYMLEIASSPLYGKAQLRELEERRDQDYLTGQLGGNLRMRLHIRLQ